MQRWLAIMLAIVLGSGSSPMPALHVHASTDHEHPEHHHGPAIHEHASSEAHHDDGSARVEGCDPARHAVSVVFVCGVAAQPLSLHGEAVTPVTALPDPASHHPVTVPDVRVHGPPPRTQPSPRAPPSSFTA